MSARILDFSNKKKLMDKDVWDMCTCAYSGRVTSHIM